MRCSVQFISSPFFLSSSISIENVFYQELFLVDVLIFGPIGGFVYLLHPEVTYKIYKQPQTFCRCDHVVMKHFYTNFIKSRLRKGCSNPKNW